jgi:ElaB/YqjD/DUF883 family membrane-anchored ribosome-binding protein
MASTTDDLMINTDMQHSGRSSAIKERVSQATDRVKDTAAGFGRSAAENIDRNLDRTVGALHNAASSLRGRAGTGESRMSNMANTTADKLDATAQYFEHHHTREMVGDLEHVVRRNPGASIAAAAGLGFLIGMSLKRDRH